MRTVREIIEEAFALHGAGKFDEAADVYDHLLGFTVGQDANVLYAYGTLLLAQNKPGLGSHLLRCATEVYPEHAPSWCNLGIALKTLGLSNAAKQAYEQALKIEPDGAEALSNYAALFINAGNPDKVVEYARRAVEQAPDSPQAHNHLALGLLEQGQYEEAWPHYEWRWSLPDRIRERRPYKAPKWTGEKVGTLAIHGEQGIGDEIMYLGCLREASKRADRIVIECTKKALSLFAASFGVPCYTTHAELIAAEGEPDAYISMGSLPSLVGMPDGGPYLKPPRMSFDKSRPTVGITWKGGTDKTNKRERTTGLGRLAPILAVPGLNFVSVQYGDNSEAKDSAVLPLPLNDFEMISARIGACDLVISVCQTAVHQAGAMGVPCWVLTPKACSWRYIGGEQMAWYRSVKLYRQGDDEDWVPVIERIAADLRARFA